MEYCNFTFAIIFRLHLLFAKKNEKGIMPWVGIYDYYFLKPILEDKINHYNVLFNKYFLVFKYIYYFFTRIF